MPEFAISVIDGTGRRRSLRESAADEPTVRERLRSQGLWPITVRPARTASKLSRLHVLVYHIVTDKWVFLSTSGVGAESAARALQLRAQYRARRH